MDSSVSADTSAHHSVLPTTLPTPTPSRRGILTRAVAALGILGLAAGCSTGPSDSPAPAANTTITVVASTDVWGGVAQEVADELIADAKKKVGADKESEVPAIEVTSIVSGTDVDPHEYEATARDLAQLKQADIVVANGGGYDTWLTDNASPESTVVTAVDVAAGHAHNHGDHDHGDHGDHGDHAHDHAADATPTDDAAPASDAHDHAHDHGDHAHATPAATDTPENTHVWFDVDRVAAFADNLAAALNKHYADYGTDINDFRGKLEDTKATLAKLDSRSVIVTEPIAEFLITDSQLRDVTPAELRQAQLRETEPSAAAIASAQELIRADEVSFLVTNPQSETPASAQLRDAAKEKKLPIVAVYENPEQGQGYLDYLNATVDSLSDAVADSQPVS